MANNNEQEAEIEETLDLPETKEGEEDLTDWKAEAQKLRDKAMVSKERAKSLRDKLAEKDAAIAALAGTKKPEPSKTGELDETQLDYLDVKGISEAEDIKVIEDIVKKTGMTVRQTLKDDYVLKKLEANKAARDVKDATPSATKRSGGSQSNDLETALAKYTAAGYSPDALPTDFKLRLAVVNAVANATKTNKPSWH
jgi:hypothetical protein